MLVSRIYTISMNPIWTYPEINQFILIIGILSVLHRSTTKWKESIIRQEDNTDDSCTETLPLAKWFPVMLSFGGWCFMVQLLYADVAVLSRWVVQGYPDKGPMPNPWGYVYLLYI